MYTQDSVIEIKTLSVCLAISGAGWCIVKKDYSETSWRPLYDTQRL